MKKFIFALFAFILVPILGKPAVYNAAGAELLQRLFLTEIQPLLFANNDWFNMAQIDDAFVNNNSVELPHSGTIPTVGVNRKSLPALTSQRSDIATNYVLDELTTDPTLIQDSEAYIVAYDKRSSVLGLHAMAINDKAAIRALYAWSQNLVQNTNYNTTTGYFASGSGGSAVVRSSSAPGSTKTGIHALSFQDIVNARQVLDSQNLRSNGATNNRAMLVTPQMYGDLLALPQFTYLQNFGNVVLPSGSIQTALGFQIFVRTITPVYTWNSSSSQTLKAEGAVGIPTTDVASAMFWDSHYVRRGKGATKVYVTPDQAQYYGTLFSMMVRFGGAQTRFDQKGIVEIVEA